MTGPVMVPIATESEQWRAWVARGIARDKRSDVMMRIVLVAVAATALALGLTAQFI